MRSPLAASEFGSRSTSDAPRRHVVETWPSDDHRVTERAGIRGWLERPSHLREKPAITAAPRGMLGRIAAQRRGPRPAPQAASVCPHLGRDGDAGTHHEGANAAHRCFREATRPYAISETHQTACCFSREHRQCPAQANGWRRVARKTRRAAVSPAGRKRSRRSRPSLASPFGFAAIIVLVFAAILAAATTIGDFLSDDYEQSSGQQLADGPDGTSAVPSDPRKALVRAYGLEVTAAALEVASSTPGIAS